MTIVTIGDNLYLTGNMASGLIKTESCCMFGRRASAQPEREASIMDMKEVICECMGTKAGDIRKLVEGGMTDVEEIKAATKAGTSCGMCIQRIEKIIDMYK